MGLAQYSCQIHIRMDPRLRLAHFDAKKSENDPDLILWLDHMFFRENEVEIDKLQRGDTIKFMGYLSRLHITAPSLSMTDSTKAVPHEQIHFEDNYPHL